MDEKKCIKCGVVKPLSEFYKHPQTADGHLNKCKSCCKQDNVDNYKKNREYYHSYDKSRAKTDKRRAWCRQKLRNYRADNPLANKARRDVAYALRAGKLKKEPCFCGEAKVEAHHPDYNQSLMVVWLCHKHHKEIHGRKVYE